ncbi:MAG: hypothetical protein KDA83_04390 [Planctomycetales bacterium]|nr:hypothetical protein [Planctomycetales bacterium]
MLLVGDLIECRESTITGFSRRIHHLPLIGDDPLEFLDLGFEIRERLVAIGQLGRFALLGLFLGEDVVDLTLPPLESFHFFLTKSLIVERFIKQHANQQANVLNQASLLVRGLLEVGLVEQPSDLVHPLLNQHLLRFLQRLDETIGSLGFGLTQLLGEQHESLLHIVEHAFNTFLSYAETGATTVLTRRPFVLSQ